MVDFDSARLLAKAGGRAKSDVANKLVSMALHQLSQQLESRLTVRSEQYRQAVREEFRNCCPYCDEPLSSSSNTILEHLDAMNQFRAGLHVPGNVLPACRPCNLEKRRDDQARALPDGVGGWEQFLSHDSTSCKLGCKTCMYWEKKWSGFTVEQRRCKLQTQARRIAAFRERFLPPGAQELSKRIAPQLRHFYESAQAFAKDRTSGLVQDALKTGT